MAAWIGASSSWRRDAALFDVWFAHWSDLVSFEVLPVITSAEAAARAET